MPTFLYRGSHLTARQPVLIEAMKPYPGFDLRQRADIEVITFRKHVLMIEKKDQ